jgi:quercetin dioxygenase-like cupin family protein
MDPPLRFCFDEFVALRRIVMLNASEPNHTDVLPRAHQPDQDRFHAIRPEDVQWTTFAAYPPALRMAILVGNPAGPGPYTIRVRVPGGVKMMPHKHPEDRIYTVLSGVFYVGLGEQFDDRKLTAYAPGSIVVLPGNQPHFHWAKSGEYMTQITGMGPLGLDYVDPDNDPRISRRP